MHSCALDESSLSIGKVKINFDESHPININMTGFRVFKKTLHSCALDESSLSTGRVKINFDDLAHLSVSLILHVYYPPLDTQQKLEKMRHASSCELDI